jgi:ribosomal protein S18 acetylase RimI-like enzyme
MLEIRPLQNEYIPAAAELFAVAFTKQRRALPVLPERMEDPAITAALLERLLARSAGVVAFEDGRLAGFLGWWLVDDFRDTPRKAGYVPEWAHAAQEESKPAVYRALYRAAAASWCEAGCDTHAITLLAGDEAALKTWFWNGFGLAVVDAVRTVEPLRPGAPGPLPAPPGCTLRQAEPADADALAELEAEHVLHYARPPVLMVPFVPNDASAYRRFLEDPANCVWLALKDGQPAELAAYLRFENFGHGAAECMRGPGSVANTGAYVRPAYRGLGMGPALLDVALADFSARGFVRCTVDFESFNPEAVAFWLRYFQPACFSLMRVPEKIA